MLAAPKTPQTLDFIGSNRIKPRISPPATSPSPAQKKPSAVRGLTHPRAPFRAIFATIAHRVSRSVFSSLRHPVHEHLVERGYNAVGALIRLGNCSDLADIIEVQPFDQSETYTTSAGYSNVSVPHHSEEQSTTEHSGKAG